MAARYNIPYLPLKHITAMHGDEIQRAVTRVVSSGWYLQGEELKAFESSFARYTRHSHCIGCANGLDALTLILTAYKEMGLLGEGDEVIVPANTYIASVLAISASGLIPVLVEPRLETFQIDDTLIEAAITSRTRCLMIVHLYGYSAYTEHIGHICRKHNLLLVEDCAQAHGLNHAPLPDGIVSASAYSFYPGKNLGALGDGGAVVTDHEAVAETVRYLANYGSKKKYIFRYKGRNSRLDEIQAAVLSVKLNYLDEDNKRRRDIAHRYISEINNPHVSLPPAEGVFHIFPILCDQRDKLQQHLTQQGIGTIVHYPVPPHRQDAYSELAHLHLPVTDYIHDHELSLPCHPAMTDDECTAVIEAVNNFR